MRRGDFVWFAVAVWLGAPDAARAQDAAKNQSQAACDRFGWTIARERGWFSANLEPTPSGARLAEPHEAILLDLEPTSSVHFVLTPERPPKPDSFSGDVIIAGVAAPGVYQITLSDEAWIDVFENDARLKSTAFTGQKDCPRRAQERALRADARRAHHRPDQQFGEESGQTGDRAGLLSAPVLLLKKPARRGRKSSPKRQFRFPRLPWPSLEGSVSSIL